MPLSFSTTNSPSRSAVSAGSAATALAMRSNRCVQSSCLRVSSLHLAAIEPRLDAIAVEFDLVQPFGAARRVGRATWRDSAARSPASGRATALRRVSRDRHLASRSAPLPQPSRLRFGLRARAPTFRLRVRLRPRFRHLCVRLQLGSRLRSAICALELTLTAICGSSAFAARDCCARRAFCLCRRRSRPSSGRSPPTAAPPPKYPRRVRCATLRPCL